MRQIRLFFIGQPVAKGRPKISTFGGHARAYTPAKTRHAEADLRAQLKPQLPVGWTAIKGPVSMFVNFRRQKPKSHPKRLYPHTKPDIDNLLKLLTDALNSIVFEDDAQIVKLLADKTFGEPGISVMITELPTNVGDKID